MIEYKKGNILIEPVEALVNTVNCVGIMGRGIALQFKKSYPENFKAYEIACKHQEVKPGKVFIFHTGSLLGPQYIINFPTKRHWRGKSKIEDIKSGLLDLAYEMHNLNIKSIAIPPLGCGLGGLNWQEVRNEIESTLSCLSDINIIVFEPNELTSNEKNPSKEVPTMTSGRAALVGLINSYLKGLMDPFITLLEIHKLMYFMQESGHPLKLKYIKALYGPYAENLRHVLNHVEGYLTSGYADGGDSPDKKIQLVPGAVNDAMEFLKSDENNTIKHFEKVSELVEGFETPYGLELLATVHWVVSKENVTSESDLIKAIYSWNARKRQFTERQIKLAYERLINKGWVS
jgi:O-acetyl-ADP-ribose deacetylase (regulator of RNase III)